MYQPSIVCEPKVLLLLGLVWINTLVPGGARGVELKSKFSNIPTYADNDGFLLKDRSRLRVSEVWGNRCSHSLIGFFWSHVHNPVMRWFLNVWITLSAAFLRCMCGVPIETWLVHGRKRLLDLERIHCQGCVELGLLHDVWERHNTLTKSV